MSDSHNKIKPICHKFNSYQEAEVWEIQHYQEMSPDERLNIAKTLKIRVYGKSTPDIRESYKES